MPVLWTPLLEEHDPPRYAEALDLGATEPDYAENGLRALLRIAPYHDSYEAVLRELALRIVTIAEEAPLAPATVPDIDEIESPFKPSDHLAGFTIVVVAPTASTAPKGRDRGSYGTASTDWRPFPEQELSLAEYARQVAERLDFKAEVTGFEKPAGPGLLLIDPWLVAGSHGRQALEGAIAGLPPWVLPLQVISPAPHPRTEALAQQVRDMLSAAGAMSTESSRRAGRGVSSLDQFVKLVPELVAEAERQYLRRRRKAGSERNRTRPRLRPATPSGKATLAPDRAGEASDAGRE